MTDDAACTQMKAARPPPPPRPPSLLKDPPGPDGPPGPGEPADPARLAEGAATPPAAVNGDVGGAVPNGDPPDRADSPTCSPGEGTHEEAVVIPRRANRVSRGSNFTRFLKRRSTPTPEDVPLPEIPAGAPVGAPAGTPAGAPMGAPTGVPARTPSRVPSPGVTAEGPRQDNTGENCASANSREIDAGTGTCTGSGTPGAAKEKPRGNSLLLRKRVTLGGAGTGGSGPSPDEVSRNPGAILTRQLSRRDSHSRNPINENEWARLLLLFVGTLLGLVVRALLFLWWQACSFFSEEADDTVGVNPGKPAGDLPLIPLKPEIKDTGRKERIFNICNELKNTEQVYVDRLEILVMAKEKATAIVGADVTKQMFKDIEVICLFHKDYFLPDLKERMEKWEEHKKIGDIMRKLTPYLKLYTDYVKDFQKASALVDHWENKSSTFAAMIREIRDNQAPRHGKLKVQAHMIEPIQRVPRYELLLRDYLKRLPDDAPDKADSEKALESVSQAASHFEDVMRRDSRIAKLIEIRERLDCFVNIVLPSREFISENKLNIFNQRTQKPSEKTTFLFNDLFIVCSHQKMHKIMTSMKLKVKVAIDLREAELITGTNLDIPYTLWVQTKESQVELCFSSASEIMQWRQGLIDAFTKTLARNSTCSSTDSTEGDDTLEVVHEGYMQVSSDDARTWRRRWVLVGTCGRLCAYKTQQDKVPLSWIRIVRFNLESAQNSKKPNTLLLQGFGRKYFLHFDNQNECNEWLEVLQRYQEPSSSDSPGKGVFTEGEEATSA